MKRAKCWPESNMHRFAAQRQWRILGVRRQPGATRAVRRTGLHILQHSLGECLFARQRQWRGVDGLSLPKSDPPPFSHPSPLGGQLMRSLRQIGKIAMGCLQLQRDDANTMHHMTVLAYLREHEALQMDDIALQEHTKFGT